MQTRIHVQREDFDLNAEMADLTTDGEAGAVASFTGHVRKEGDLSTLTLEHYPHMTEAEIARIVAEAGTRWPLTGVTVIHRVGQAQAGRPHRPGGGGVAASSGRVPGLRIPDGLSQDPRALLEGRGAVRNTTLGRAPPQRRRRRQAVGVSSDPEGRNGLADHFELRTP